VSRPQFRDAAELLRDRDFAKLFAAHMVAWFGTSMAPIAMAFGVLHAPTMRSVRSRSRRSASSPRVWRWRRSVRRSPRGSRLQWW
jgi:hypothetical protein